MAISHVKSDTIADFTSAQVTVFNSQGSTTTVAATDLVRPSDWNSAHNQYVTISGANTAGQSTASGTNLVYGASNSATLSLSTAANAATLWIVPAQSNLTAGAGISLSSNGSTVSIINLFTDMTLDQWPWPPYPLAASTVNSGTTGSTGGSFQTTCSYHMAPYPILHDVQVGDIEFEISYQTVAGTGSHTAGWQFGLYSRNVATFTLISNFQWSYAMSQNSISAQTHRWGWGTNSTSNSGGLTNSSVSLTGLKRIDIYESNTRIPEGEYYLAVCHTGRSSGALVCNISSGMFVSFSQTTGGYFGSNTTQTAPYVPYQGVFSSTHNSANSAFTNNLMPASIHSSVLTNTGGTTQHKIPHFYIYAST
jgi:hypothetical protein